MALFEFVKVRFWKGKIGFVVGFGPVGRLSRLNYDLIHNGFELTEFFDKKNRIGDEPCVLIWWRC